MIQFLLSLVILSSFSILFCLSSGLHPYQLVSRNIKFYHRIHNTNILRLVAFFYEQKRVLGKCKPIDFLFSNKQKNTFPFTEKAFIHSLQHPFLISSGSCLSRFSSFLLSINILSSISLLFLPSFNWTSSFEQPEQEQAEHPSLLIAILRWVAGTTQTQFFPLLPDFLHFEQH